jgi:hypothetical protein
MLKESIYVWVNCLGEREFDSIHELVKEYFRLYIDKRVNGFDGIEYRGHELKINDERGYTDAIEIEEDLCRQIQKINSKDGE